MAKTADEKLDMLLEAMAVVTQKVTALETGLIGVKNEVSGLKGEVSGLKGEVSELKQKVASIDERLTNVENTVTKIESGHGEKLSVLFDGYTQNKEQLKRMENKLDELNGKVEKNDIEIKVIKGGKYNAK